MKGVSGIDVQLRDEGTLILAITADDRARLMHQLAFQQKLDSRSNGSMRRKRADASRILPRRSLARCTVLRIIRLTTASSLRLCGKRRAPPARLSMSTRRLRRVNTFCDDTLKAHMARLIKHMRTVCF